MELALGQHEGERVEGAVSGEIEANGAWRFAVGDMQIGERRALRIQDQEGPLASLTEMLLDLQEVQHVDHAIGVEVEMRILAVEQVGGEEAVA